MHALCMCDIHTYRRSPSRTHASTQLKVRRDWCVLSKATGRFVIDQILSGENRDAVSRQCIEEREKGDG